MKEIRLVVTEKRVFVTRDKPELIAQYRIFRLSQFQVHDSNRNKKQLLNLILRKTIYCSIQTLTEKNIPVVKEKFEIEYGDESLLLAHLDSSDN